LRAVEIRSANRKSPRMKPAPPPRPAAPAPRHKRRRRCNAAENPKPAISWRHHEPHATAIHSRIEAGRRINPPVTGPLPFRNMCHQH
jgi:hypothetical protein